MLKNKKKSFQEKWHNLWFLINLNGIYRRLHKEEEKTVSEGKLVGRTEEINQRIYMHVCIARDTDNKIVKARQGMAGGSGVGEVMEDICNDFAERSSSFILVHFLTFYSTSH